MFMLLPVLLIVNTPGLNFEAAPNPQLDLPPLPPPSSARPQILINSYTQKEQDSQNYHSTYSSDSEKFDRDRSNRYGPPYENNNDDNIDFDRLNQYNSNRYGNNNNNYNNDNSNRYQNDNRNRYREYEQQQIHEQIQNENLKRLLYEIDQKSSHECSLNVAAQWLFETNVNEVTQLNAVAAQQRYSDFQRALWLEMSKIDENQIYDEQLYRQVKLMSVIGSSALPPDQLDRYNRIINDMLAIYNEASICAYEQPFHCGLKLQPHLKQIMAKSRDWEELQYTWLEFRRKSGRNIRDLFDQTADITNEAAKFNNFSNAEQYWMYPYDSGRLRFNIETVWNEIQPFYELIHAYVRRKLREFYGPDKISRDAPLPEHILGNMYGQTWSNILDITIPYPGRSFLEVTPEMIAQGYNPLIMFKLAEEFFVSLNMSILPEEFWLKSILEEPVDRVVLCQPSAWDFCTGFDYRIKMCTRVTHKDLITAHHEMAHVHYFLNYRDLPKVFRDGANPGFHEAIGDAISLSVATPKHLQKLGLVRKSVDDTAHDINFLFALALDKVVFLPFALALEEWRWDIFSKRITKEQYNCHWWLLREKYGGVKPPVLRSELDFDPGSKYHVAANIPYIRY